MASLLGDSKKAQPMIHPLQELLGNLTLLYIKAKDFHWNVSGPEFYGLHKTFDGIQDVALDWADTIGERMRALQIPVRSTAATYVEQAWYPEAEFDMDAEAMKADMVKTLECISSHLMEDIGAEVMDEVTLNMMQDLCANIDKQCYFVRSSI